VSRRKTLAIPIVVEFGPGLKALEDAAERSNLQGVLEGRLAALLAETGIPGTPQISFQAGTSTRELSLRVHLAKLFPSVELMQRVWMALAPVELHTLLDQPTGQQPAGLDGWLVKYVGRLDEAQDSKAWDLALRYLTRLVVELLRQRASSLLDQAQAVEYLKAGFAQFPRFKWPGADQPDALAAVWGFLKGLLDLGISLTHQKTIFFVLNAGLQLGRSWEDSLESAFLRLRSNRIEIHANEQDLQGVIEWNDEGYLIPVTSSQVSQEFKEGIQYLLEILYTELGVRQPDITLAVSAENESGVVAFKINDTLSPPVRLISPDEALINASLEAVKAAGFTARTGRVPVTGLGASIVSKDDQNAAQENGFRTWNWLGYIHIALANELRFRAGWLVSLEDVEYQLAQLEPDAPELVYAVMELYPMEDLTRVLRALAAENVPIRDLRAVCEAVLRYEAIPVDAGVYQVLDPRLPVPNMDSLNRERDWMGVLKFVRKELRDQITDFITYGTNSLEVYLLGERLEGGLHDLAIVTSDPPVVTGKADRLVDAILEAVRARVAQLSPVAEWPVVVTGIDQRRFLRKLVEGEFPRLRVAAFHDLSAGVQATAVDHIEISS
jgi:hypothetical protein